MTRLHDFMLGNHPPYIRTSTLKKDEERRWKAARTMNAWRRGSITNEEAIREFEYLGMFLLAAYVKGATDDQPK